MHYTNVNRILFLSPCFKTSVTTRSFKGLCLYLQKIFVYYTIAYTRWKKEEVLYFYYSISVLKVGTLMVYYLCSLYHRHHHQHPYNHFCFSNFPKSSIQTVYIQTLKHLQTTTRVRFALSVFSVYGHLSGMNVRQLSPNKAFFHFFFPCCPSFCTHRQFSSSSSLQLWSIA